MKLVSESYQEFKQGGDPYKKLGIGSNVYLKHIIERLKIDIKYNNIQDEYTETIGDKMFGFFLRDPYKGLNRPSQIKNKIIETYWDNKIMVAAYYGKKYNAEQYLFGDIVIKIPELTDTLYDMLSKDKTLRDFLK